MKKFLPLAFLICGNLFAQKTISIKGSETLLPVVLGLKSIMTGDTTLQISGGGSNIGMKALLKDSIDVAMVSRSIRTQEKLDAARKGKILLGVAIAKDPLAIVINPKNAVKNLTLDQVRSIFSGEINNWSALGGSNAPIQVWIRDEKSGTQTFFKEYVMHNEPFAANVKIATTHEAATHEIEKDPNAIGFAGISFTHMPGMNVKVLAIGYSEEKYTLPVANEVLNKDYPIIRNLYLSYFEEDMIKVKPLVNKALSPSGQKIITDQGLFPVSSK